jgi:hypothetical protein
LCVCILLSVGVAVVLAIHAPTILATRSAHLPPAELTAALAIHSGLRSVLSAIDSAIGQAADEVTTVITYSALADESRSLEVQNSIGGTAVHQLTKIRHLARDHALLLSPGKRARATARRHATNAALAEGPAGAARAQSAESAGAGTAGRAPAKSTGSTAGSASAKSAAPAAILRAGSSNRNQTGSQ